MTILDNCCSRYTEVLSKEICRMVGGFYAAHPNSTDISVVVVKIEPTKIVTRV